MTPTPRHLKSALIHANEHYRLSDLRQRTLDALSALDPADEGYAGKVVEILTRYEKEVKG